MAMAMAMGTAKFSGIIFRNCGFLQTPSFTPWKKRTSFFCSARNTNPKSSEELLVVVGGGAAGIYGAIRAKTVAPNLDVVVIEKLKPLSKVRISGGGRCNVTNGHCADNMLLAEQYPRGHKELKGSFFNMHSPADTMSWFTDHGVKLKTEDDGRVFPVSNSSSSVIDCLMNEAKQRGGTRSAGSQVRNSSAEIHDLQIMGGLSMHEENTRHYHWKTPRTHYPTQSMPVCEFGKGGSFRGPGPVEALNGRIGGSKVPH